MWRVRRHIHTIWTRRVCVNLSKPVHTLHQAKKWSKYPINYTQMWRNTHITCVNTHMRYNTRITCVNAHMRYNTQITCVKVLLVSCSHELPEIQLFLELNYCPAQVAYSNLVFQHDGRVVLYPLYQYFTLLFWEFFEPRNFIFSLGVGGCMWSM